jgi:hypothetical protein
MAAIRQWFSTLSGERDNCVTMNDALQPSIPGRAPWATFALVAATLRWGDGQGRRLYFFTSGVWGLLNVVAEVLLNN